LAQDIARESTEPKSAVEKKVTQEAAKPIVSPDLLVGPRLTEGFRTVSVKSNFVCKRAMR